METDGRILETVDWINRLVAKQWPIEKICITGRSRVEVISIIEAVFPKSIYINSSQAEISWSLDGKILVATPADRDDWNMSWKED
ncbi:MAG: hypothetical protein WC467_04190 [Patescibacteria group bacterium]